MRRRRSDEGRPDRCGRIDQKGPARNPTAVSDDARHSQYAIMPYTTVDPYAWPLGKLVFSGFVPDEQNRPRAGEETPST